MQTEKLDIEMLKEYQTISKQVWELDLQMRHTLFKLQIEIPETWAEYSRLKAYKDTIEKPADDFVNPLIKSDKEKSKNKANKNPECKRLYRIISQITHPDKTDKTDLHQIFQLAKVHYDCDNVVELKMLFEMVALRKFTDITESLNKQRNKLFNMLHSIEWQICRLFEEPSTTDQAIATFNQLILTEISKLKR